VFFSPFIFNKELAELANVWKMNDPNWLIVAFDLLKSIQRVLEAKELSEIKNAIPQILLSYVIPKL
jgi:hypothetical protein